MNETYKRIKTILDGEVGKPLKEYLIDSLNELKNIDNIKDVDTPTAQAIELKAQKRAYKKLEEILTFILTVEGLSEDGTDEENYSS
jgi:hypothetical protein